MKKIKPSAVAGSFYEGNKKELLLQLKDFFSKNEKYYPVETRAIIVPHAGHYYSGQLASEGFYYLSKKVKNIFIIAPVHHVAVDEPVLTTYDEWSTPIGNISVNQKINEELIEKFGCIKNDIPFDKEHSVEVQVPFIQYTNDKANIIPILVGHLFTKNISEIIEHYYDNPENAFVISTDLSHFYTDQEAKRIDLVTADMIELQDVENFHPQQACGSSGLLSMIEFAKRKNFSLIRVGMMTSADVSGDESRVVGYGSWLLYEETKSEFVKKYFSDLVLEICSKTIALGLNGKQLDVLNEYKDIPPVLNETGSCFVTLKINGDLRGCIGSIIAHQPLLRDLVQNAYNAAFADNRFYPLTEEEFDNLEISVSLLSEPKKMSFEDEADFMDQIVPFTDGIIIKDGMYQAVYLPSVWEQLPDKEDFIRSLKQKAGLGSEHFSKSFEAYKFTTEHIG